MKKCRVSVMKVVCCDDLIEKYENLIETVAEDAE